MDFEQNIYIDDSSQAISFEKDGEKIEITSYQGVGMITKEGKLQYSGKLPRVSIEGIAGTFHLDGFNFDIVSNLDQKYGKYLAPGHFYLNIPSLKAKVMGGMMSAELAGATIESKATFNQAKNVADLSINLAIGRLSAMDEEVNNAALEINYKNISLIFMDKYMNLVQQYGAVSGEDANMMAVQLSGLVASDLIPAGPSVEIKTLTMSMPEGSLDFSASASIAPEAASKMANPFAMIGDIDVEAATTISKNLLHRFVAESAKKGIKSEMMVSGNIMTPEEITAAADHQATSQISMLTISGYFKEEGDNYVSDFQFKNGKALMNDQPIPLPF